MSVEVAFAKRDSKGNMRRSVLVFATYAAGATAAAAIWNTFHDEHNRGYLMRTPEEFLLGLKGEASAERITAEDWHKDFYVQVSKRPDPSTPLHEDPQYA